MEYSPAQSVDQPNVALFVTCLVDMYRPSVGFASIKLLEQAGCKVSVPEAQTCCGQPAFNSGDRKVAVKIAQQVIEAFEGFDYVVVPSGSCGGMIIKHYAELFSDMVWKERATTLANKTHELTSFLSDVRELRLPHIKNTKSITYHDSCAGLRELGVKQQPRELLGQIDGLSLTEMADTDVCCGFGGTFCVKYPDVSNKMVSNKTDAITRTGADVVLAGDMGCLLNIAGKLSRENSKVEVRHVAEVLAELDKDPAIGQEN